MSDATPTPAEIAGALVNGLTRNGAATVLSMTVNGGMSGEAVEIDVRLRWVPRVDADNQPAPFISLPLGAVNPGGPPTVWMGDDDG